MRAICNFMIGPYDPERTKNFPSISIDKSPYNSL